ncbi:MAG: hypothetical protein ACI8RZ_001070 [Myxococcota bacterium]|jgi:hypothetical protein
MGGHSEQPQYSGFVDKNPGLIATIITLVVGTIFLGGLFREYKITESHHGEAHGEAGDHAPAGGEHAPDDHAPAGDDHAEGEGDH